MAKRLPYFKWYPADADTDENFRAMDDADIGFYIRCLNHAWMNGGIPADPKERARVLRTRLDVANKRWERVGKSFVSSTLYPDSLINLRQEVEREHASSKSVKATESVNVRYERSIERSTDVPIRACARSVSVSVSDSSSLNLKSKPEEETITRANEETAIATISQEKKLASEYAPAIHERHVNRKCSLKKTITLLERILKSRPKDEQLTLIQRIDVNHRTNCESWNWTKDEGQFCPGLAVWLNCDEERYLLGGSVNVPAVDKLHVQRNETLAFAKMFGAMK